MAPSSAKVSDKVVASLEDSLVRQSDLSLLDGPHWLNDALIGFYFEFLHQRKFESSSRICFISPEVSQFLKLASAVEIPVFLDPLHLEEKETVLMAVNNASDPSQPGGSHWSLLIFTRQAMEFFHLDSSPGLNDGHARQLAAKVHDFLVKKTENRFKLLFSDVDVVRQDNGYDCGLHVLNNAEHATRHFMVYGSAEGANLTDPDSIKNKREEVKRTIVSLAKSCEAGEEDCLNEDS